MLKKIAECHKKLQPCICGSRNLRIIYEYTNQGNSIEPHTSAYYESHSFKIKCLSCKKDSLLSAGIGDKHINYNDESQFEKLLTSLELKWNKHLNIIKSINDFIKIQQKMDDVI